MVTGSYGHLYDEAAKKQMLALGLERKSVVMETWIAMVLRASS